MLIEWRDEFKIGIPAVDHEHRQLVELINALHARISDKSDSAVVEGFLADLFSEISAHFALEEKLMRDLTYDQTDAHKAEHERLLDEIRDIMEAYGDDAYYDYEDALGIHLKIWFTDHFGDADVRLHRFLQDAGH